MHGYLDTFKPSHINHYDHKSPLQCGQYQAINTAFASTLRVLEMQPLTISTQLRSVWTKSNFCHNLVLDADMSCAVAAVVPKNMDAHANI